MPEEFDDDERKKRDALEQQADPLAARFNKPQQAAPAPQIAPPAPAPTNVGAAATPAQPANNGPSPTGFTNFSRVKSANQAVSNREAAAYGQRAAVRADAAKQSLDALKARFGGQVESGTVAAPIDPTSNTAPLTPEQEIAQKAAGKFGSTPSTYGGPTSGELYAEGDRSYSGPGGLGDVEGVEDTYGKTLGAEQNLDALGNEAGMSALIQQQNAFGNEGTSKLSAGLIGNAGRKDFDALRNRFHPENDINTAETEAAAQAKAAGDTSNANAAEFRKRGDAMKATEDQQAAARARAGQSGADDEALKARTAQAMKDFDSTDKGDARLGAKTVFEYLDPINYVSGGKRGFGMKWFGDTFGEDYKGNISWSDNAMDRDVYSQMDAPQWEELSQLTGVAQRNWINQRAAELKNGTGRKRGTYAPHRGY